MLPSLGPEEIERWIALGRQGTERTRAGDGAGAEAAYRAQIEIYRLSPQPYLALAFLQAGRGDEKAAIANLRAAVARGFTDLQRFSRAEGAAKVRKTMAMLELEDAVPVLQKIEDEWAGWDAFQADTAPPSLAEALKIHGKLHERVALMAPVLGDRQVRLWKRVIDRSTAIQLETYVTKRKDAADLDDALARLMAIYAEGPTLRWEAPPVAAAQRLTAVSNLVLARGKDHPLRPGALAVSAVAQNANRDAKRALKPAAADWIRSSLDEVLGRYPSSPFASVAAVGLVRTEAELGRMERASSVYKGFESSHAGEPAVLAEVRQGLGTLALRAGGLPAFEATTLEGTVVSPASLRGKVTVLDFWATWCRPCVDGFPTLRRIQTKHGDRVDVVGVSLDDMPVDELKTWIATEGLAGRHIQEGIGWDSEVVQKFGVREIPFSVVIGADGTVLAVNEHGKGLEKAVAAALARN